MKVTINKSIGTGIVLVPPSKSYAHRLLIAAALTNNDVVVSNINLSEDIKATISCLQTIGFNVLVEGNQVFVKKRLKDLPEELTFNCNESGSTLRFFIPIALTFGKRCIFTGTTKLISRGIEPYLDICKEQNIKVFKEESRIIFEGQLKSSTFKVVGNVSSQFITGLLFALPLLDKKSILEITTDIESKNYIDITLDVLKQAGIKIIQNNNGFEIKGNQKYCLENSYVEGDYSNASFLDALNYLGGNVKLVGLNNNSLQGDKKYIECFQLLNDRYVTIDLANCIDLGPILFVFASLKHGGHFINTKRLKIKESNRITDLAHELKKFGVIVKELDNEVYIDNTNVHEATTILDGCNDHRIVMALSVMLTRYGGSILGVEAINKSYPNFFNDLKNINIEVIVDAE